MLTCNVVSIQPATVSRCGMIYLEPSSLGWEPVLQSWCNTLPDELGSEHEKLIKALFHWALPVSITFVRKHCKVSASPYRIHLLCQWNMTSFLHVWLRWLHTDRSVFVYCCHFFGSFDIEMLVSFLVRLFVYLPQVICLVIIVSRKFFVWIF